MVTVIYAFKSANPTRYVGQIGKERFVKAVAQDAQIPEHKVRSEMTRSRDVSDLDLTYEHFHRVVKHDANGRRVLKILEVVK